MSGFEQFAGMAGVKVIREADVPSAIVDVLKGVATVDAFQADELPPGFDLVFGAGPGVTFLVLDEECSPRPTERSIRTLVADVEELALAEAARWKSGDGAEAVDEALVAALLELSATPPSRASELRAKNRCLRRHSTGRIYPIAREMIEAALLVDAEGWGRGKIGH
jgi:hypothetical protein